MPVALPNPAASIATTKNLLVVSRSVAASSLHIRKPRLYHLYALPFAVPVYALWAHIYLFFYDAVLGTREFTFLSLVLIVTIHVLVFLSGEWSITAKAFITCSKVKTPEEADIIRVIPTEHAGNGALCSIIKTNVAGASDPRLSFKFQQETFIFNRDKKLFEPIEYIADLPVACFRTSIGLNTKQIDEARLKYGPNIFDIPALSFTELFREHGVAPFFVFQIFCVGLWALDEFWYYSLFTLFMLFVFESTVVFQRLRTIREFRTMVHKPYSIQAFRNSEWTILDSSAELFPGDLVSIVRPLRDEHTVPCDLVLVYGNVIVNEAMLSGESTPLMKESVVLRNDDVILDETLPEDACHVVHAGTKIVQVTPPSGASIEDYMPQGVPLPPNGGCIAVVVRTGFGTSQGQLVRMMIFSSERISANNMESFLFIAFLLFFAIIAASYVFMNANKHGERETSKLILHCILIVTSVIPPELPMELSMAVNASLLALAKSSIFCTEPFRIPFAGKLDVLCFDKTGTITEENLVVEGVAGIDGPISDGSGETEWTTLRQAAFCPRHTIIVLACAHSLVYVSENGNKVVGDPMEKAALDAANFDLVATDIVRPRKPATPAILPGARYNGNGIVLAEGKEIHILRKYPFSSSLKRMSTVARIQGPRSMLVAAVKGAPETLEKMLSSVPPRYAATYKHLMRNGGRVLALGWKCIENLECSIEKIGREAVESNLNFAGFLVFSSPLKQDSKAAIEELSESCHRCVMITGDNALTACHVAQQVGIATRKCLILGFKPTKNQIAEYGQESSHFEWRTADDVVFSPFSFDEIPVLVSKFDLCVTGDVIGFLMENKPIVFARILCYIYVWARVSPTQKEAILKGLKDLGYMTLMCGDGTNDVGALKQAHVGVALLDCTAEDLFEISQFSQLMTLSSMYEKQCQFALRLGAPQPPPKPAVLLRLEENWRQRRKAKGLDCKIEKTSMDKTKSKASSAQGSSLAATLMDMQAGGEVPTINLGDASVSAPFTSKIGSLRSICSIVKQGRCTLVTTLQMYKILALNCLISAYSMSVLFLDGVKWGDRQLVAQGLISTVCFFCITRGQPLDRLAAERPQARLFTVGTLISLLGQFAVHAAALFYVSGMCKQHMTERLEVDFEGTAKFEPNILNSGIFLLALSMLVSTFVINYKGRPFREDITDNRALFRGLVFALGASFAGAAELSPELNTYMQIVLFPEGFSSLLITVMAVDFSLAYAIGFVTNRIFKPPRSRPELRM